MSPLSFGVWLSTYMAVSPLCLGVEFDRAGKWRAGRAGVGPPGTQVPHGSNGFNAGWSAWAIPIRMVAYFCFPLSRTRVPASSRDERRGESGKQATRNGPLAVEAGKIAPGGFHGAMAGCSNSPGGYLEPGWGDVWLEWAGAM